MSATQPSTLYITYLEKEGPFLKVWGQTDKSTSVLVEQFLKSATPQFEQGVGSVHVESIQVGNLIAAKYKDNKYYRGRITNASYKKDKFVEIFFLDYGNRDIVPCANIRTVQHFPANFISIRPLASSFVFAEVHCPGGGEWNQASFDVISQELKYREFSFTIIAQATQYYLIKLFIIGGTDLAGILTSRGLLQPTSLQAQQGVMLSMSIERNKQKLAESSELNNYKAPCLDPGTQYSVYVSYVNDGPCHFSVQLQQSEETLVKLMNEINFMEHKPLEEVPLPGTICLAKCREDSNICRAVVTNQVDAQFKVFYVDFGNYEVVPLESLFQIPFRFVLPKVMAIRFALAGVEKSTVTLEMQCAFKKFVDNRMLQMKLLPATSRPVIAKCELWDPESKTSALDVVNRAALNAYPEPISLTRGFTQLVKISYVYSCSRFYVQLVSKEAELVKLMQDLQQIENETMDSTMMKIDLPCSAIYPDDGKWYRSQIVDVVGDGRVKIRYIDYGNEEIVSTGQLKGIDGELLTVLRPQAIECCLNGYQNFEGETEWDSLLEDLILEKQFTMKVVDMLDKKALVELIDENNYNVASLLLEKIAASKSQVSPMLVQAGNRIEHRKSVGGPMQQQQNGAWNGRVDRRSPRDGRGDGNGKSYVEKSNRDSNWRDGNSRTNEKNSNNDSPEKSWRQSNKGFDRNNDRNDRFKRDNKNGDRNQNNWQTNQDSGSVDTWETTTNDWNDPQSQTPPKRDSRGDSFGRDNRKDFKRREFKKDGSEISSSGSEKSFHKGPRTSSRNDKSRYNKKSNEIPKADSFMTNDSWNISSEMSVIDYASNGASYQSYKLTGEEHKVTISWFHHPGLFYCQLIHAQEEFKQMMTDIQSMYKNMKPDTGEVGAPMIGLFSEDNVLYRARILDTIGSQYKVYYIDFGNVSIVEKVWRIDKKFMELPAQAICCGLNAIEPPSVAPESNDFGKYFDKESFDCKFGPQSQEKYLVDLMSENKSISELLVLDGLAISSQFSEQTSNQIEIPMLIGQQFRAIIKSVNSLNDIILLLPCGALNCKMHNLEQATETHLDIVKQYLELTVIVFVDNIVNEILEVTLYDTEGKKLSIVDPDPGAYETVEPLCQLLLLKSVVNGFVSHAKDTVIYLQPAEFIDTILMYLEEVCDYYDKLEHETNLVPVEGLLYAAKSSDTNWYRSRCLSFDDETVTVFYLDYGNTETVSLNNIRELTSKFMEMQLLCMEVNLNTPTDVYFEKNVEVTIYGGENGWEGNVTSCDHAESLTVVNHDDEVTMTTEVQESAPIETVPEVEETSEIITKLPEGINRTSHVIISHVDSPNDFYLQLTGSLASIGELQDNLQKQLVNMPKVETPTAGILCAAPYSVDQQWYRAQVLDADDDITTVRFVDYGSTDVIDNKTTEIKTLPPNLLALEVYATRCSLKIQPIDEEWSTAASERFEMLIGGEKTITAEFLDQDEKTNYIALYSDGENVRDLLIKEKLALADEKAIEITPNCYVSHLNSPSEFWIQLENCVDELEWIAECLSTAEKFPELEDMAPGTLCAALYPDDEMWYRARILSNTLAGLELLFIDYGNSCLCSNLRQLPEDLVVTAPLAQKCSLQRPEGLPYWTRQAIDKFMEVSANGQTTFAVKKLSTGETACVELYLNGYNVVEMLVPVTEKGIVKDFKGFEGFHIEKNGKMLEQSFKLEEMPGFCFNEDSVRKFEELNNDGETLYEIEYLDEDTVRLYLNWRDIRVDLGGSKVSTLNTTKSTEGSDDPIDVSGESTNNGNTDHSKDEKELNSGNTSSDSGVQGSKNVIKDEDFVAQKTCNFVKENDDLGESNIEEFLKDLLQKGVMENIVDEQEEESAGAVDDQLKETETGSTEQMGSILNEIVDNVFNAADESSKSNRPASRISDRFNVDEKICPAVVSRPQTPLEQDAY